jgi:hypothetical protein
LGSPSSNWCATAVTEGEAGGDSGIAVVATARSRPPPRRQRDDQRCRCDKSCEDGGVAGLVGGSPHGVDGVVDAPLGVLMRHARALRNKLGKIRTFFIGIGAVGY